MKNKTTPTTIPPAGTAQAVGAAMGDMFKSMSGLNLPLQQLAAIQADYVKSATEVWNQSLHRLQGDGADKSAPIADRRFGSSEWMSNPAAAFTAQMYLLNARSLMQMADGVEGDAKTKARIRFAVQQWIDAASPSNYLALNPDALKKALDTKGESIASGMQHLLQDLRKGHVSQTDESVFEVGRNVATTAGDVVFENEFFQLIEYKPLTAKVLERPMLFVPPCINKFQRILGLRVHENYHAGVCPKACQRPVVFVSHMEHHSNQTTWLETLCEVQVIPPDADGMVDLVALDRLLEEFRERPLKIASVTSCSNVTGLSTPYHEIAERMHMAGGLCFVDFACSAPYINIDMHPPGRPEAYLDAIYFSPHKFLGGPGTSGVLIFNKLLYRNRVPDNPGGGTVDWTNPWGQHKYVDDIESREDGGTPGFLQAIRIALAIELKQSMGVERILARESELLAIVWPGLMKTPGLHILAANHPERLGLVSFYIEELHYNLAVRLLNDRFGIQVRGGCSCAGTYGHYLLQVSVEHSKSITDKINSGVLTEKPGWVRLSLHPTMTDAEAHGIVAAISELAAKHREWAADYRYCEQRNEFTHRNDNNAIGERVNGWFEALK